MNVETDPGAGAAAPSSTFPVDPPPVAPAAPGEPRLVPVPEGSLLALVRRIARKWWLIGLVSALAALAAYGWMLRTTPLYTARTVVTATESTSTSKLGGALSSLALGASQLGLDLGASSSAPAFTEFLQVLTSATLAQRLETRHHVLRQLMATRWDAANVAWLPPASPLARLQMGLRELVGQPSWVPPTPTTLAGFLTKEFTVSDPLGTGMYVIEFSYRDPAFARALLQLVLDETDAIIKERTIARSAEQIAYIREKLEEITLQEHRTAMLSAMVSEERRLLLASSSLPFAAKFVDSVSVSDLPTYPEPFKIFVVAVLGGAILTVLGILVVDLVRYA